MGCDGSSKCVQALSSHHCVGDGDADQHRKLEGEKNLLASTFACMNDEKANSVQGFGTEAQCK
jgi:hypothetical protein